MIIPPTRLVIDRDQIIWVLSLDDQFCRNIIKDSVVKVGIRKGREVITATDDILDPNNSDLCFVVTIQYQHDEVYKSDSIIVTNKMEYYLAVRSLGKSRLTFNTNLKQKIDNLISKFVESL